MHLSPSTRSILAPVVGIAVDPYRARRSFGFSRPRPVRVDLKGAARVQGVPQVEVAKVKAESAVRTYYIAPDGRVSKTKQPGCRTVRAASVSEARRLAMQ